MKHIGTVLIVGVLAAAGRADTVLLRSSESIRMVKIVAFANGRLEALDGKTGQRKLFDYAEIAMIRVDGQPDLNEGEKNFAVRKFPPAMDHYEKALTRLGPDGGSWVGVWIKTRLMNLHAAVGRIDRMVELYADLSRQIPEWVIRVSPPRNAIRATDAQLDDAARRLMEWRDASRSGKTREALQKFYQRIGRSHPPPVKPLATADLDEETVRQNDQPGPWFDAWADAQLRSGKNDSVLRISQKLFSTAQRRNLPAVFYWQGRAHLAKGEFDAAALGFLRIVIEFPASEYAPGALFYAARSASERGRLDYARRLWRELIAQFSSATDYTVVQLVEKARDYLDEKGVREP